MKQSCIQLSTNNNTRLSRAFNEEITPGRVYESGSPAGIQRAGVFNIQSCHVRPCHCVAWPHSPSWGVCLVVHWPTTCRHATVLHSPACSPLPGPRPVARLPATCCPAAVFLSCHSCLVHNKQPHGLCGPAARLALTSWQLPGATPRSSSSRRSRWPEGPRGSTWDSQGSAELSTYTDQDALGPGEQRCK